MTVVFYRHEIGLYWPPERAQVDTGYAAPGLSDPRATGAAVLLHSFAADLTALWGDPVQARDITWPW